jgi:hypothetical protein
MGPNTRAGGFRPIAPRPASGGPNVGQQKHTSRFANTNLGQNFPRQAMQQNERRKDPMEEARELRAMYNKHLQDVGVSQDVDTERYVLRNYVYETIWSLKKFVTGEHELDEMGMIAVLVFEGVNVEADDRTEYWKRNRAYIVDCINLKRSNTSGSIKREFMSKYI